MMQSNNSSFLRRVLRGPACVLACLALVGLLFVAGCTPAPKLGVVATVNGAPITFEELEARRASLFPLSLEGFTNAPRAVLLQQYQYALQELIQEQLILYEMAQKKITLPEGVFEAREALIKADYPSGAFEQMLLEEGIAYPAWRKALHAQLMVEYFLGTVIRSQISLSPAEVEEYYQAHRADFIQPEQWHFMQFTGVEKNGVQKAVQSFMQTANATAVQKNYAVVVRDIRMAKNKLPDDVTKELATAAEGKATAIKKNAETFRAFLLVEKTPERALSPADIYSRVEQVLVENKQKSVLDEWLEKRIKKSSILVHPLLGQASTATQEQGEKLPPAGGEQPPQTIEEAPAEEPQDADQGPGTVQNKANP